MSGRDRIKAEVETIRERYARRAELPPDRYSIFTPDVLQRAHSAERSLIKLLKDHGRSSPAALSVLEVGCGEGVNLLNLIRLGFNPALMTGIDLRGEAIPVARRNLPAAVKLMVGEVSSADFGAETFDIVSQSTVFSSILDRATRSAVAERIWTLTKPGGAILWYDLARDNPWNKDVEGMPLTVIRALFPRAVIDARRITLAPPIARVLAAVHPSLCTLFETIPLFRSHLLCWIGKPCDGESR